MNDTNPYKGMQVVLERSGNRLWTLVTILDGQVTSQATMEADWPVAVSRAETLAGWFDAELIVKKVGA